MQIELTEEAINCLNFWKKHSMYSHCESYSDIIVTQMREWLCRDMTLAKGSEIIEALREICNGE